MHTVQYNIHTYIHGPCYTDACDCARGPERPRAAIGGELCDDQGGGTLPISIPATSGRLACMYVRVYAYNGVCMYVCMHIMVYVCMYVCMCVWGGIVSFVCMYVCMHAQYMYSVCACYVCMPDRMYMYVCMYVCMYVGSQLCSLPEWIAPTVREFRQMWTSIEAGFFLK